MKYFLYSCLLVVIFSPSAFLHAQSTCGIVISQADEDSLPYKPPFITEPITDCTDPFDLTNDLPMPYRLQVNNNLYDTGASITIENGELPLPLEFEGQPSYSHVWPFLFKHQGSDFVFVNQFPTELPSPTEDEVREYAETYFDTEASADLYTEIYFANDQQSYFEDENGDMAVDQETGDYVRNRFNGFLEYIGEQRTVLPEPIEPGTYTLVFDEYELILSQRTWLERIRDILVTTAFAQYFEPRRFAITFTLEEVQPEGASSVLFLPGIQASRLYTDGILGTENQIWEPNANADVEKLEMTEAGESVNSVYTRDVVDELVVPLAGTNVYKGFLSFLEDLKEDEKIIKEYQPFAYDWRFDVTDIAQNGTQYENEIKSLVSEVERLAETSYTDKVTIIGHSNGGLLGKALITELVNQNKDHLVDKLVMIGTPQLGTPKAIASMLHGYDQLAVLGLVIDDDTARDVIRNMPGAYGLLPSNEYFEKVTGSLLSTDNSNTTASVRAYGGVSSQQDLNNFLLDTQNLRPDTVPIYEPSTLNALLLQQSLITKEYLDEWLPPEGIDVYEVVGTGNPTIKGFRYESFPCAVGVVVQCATGTHMEAVPQISDDGDETVVTVSAQGQDGVKVTGIVDLYEEGVGVLNINYSHLDLTESPTVQNFLDSIIKYPYISDTLVVPEFVNVTRAYKIIGVHSPVSISITDTAGKQTGMIDGEVKEDIDASQYIELSESKYVIVPNDVSFTANIKGEALGLYSLTVDLVENNTQSHVHRYLGASTTETMQASFTFANNTFSNITTDINGDSITDITATLDGQIIPPPVVYSYALLKTSIKALKLQKLLETVLIVQVDTASYWDTLQPRKPQYQKLENGALETLKATLKIYKQKKIITQEKFTSLEVIINYLKN